MSLNKIREVAVALTLVPIAAAVQTCDAHAFPAKINSSQQVTVSGKFYCNIAALTPAERAHHKQLSEKLMAARIDIVESPKGYEFQFSPSDVTLAELAEWVANEAKCCPFFDFHIDLENKGTLLCLRLTGEEGVKIFIRSEFHIPAS
jgi:hypothetical protein